MNLETKVIIDGKEFKLRELITLIDIARLISLSPADMNFISELKKILKDKPRK